MRPSGFRDAAADADEAGEYLRRLVPEILPCSSWSPADGVLSRLGVQRRRPVPKMPRTISRAAVRIRSLATGDFMMSLTIPPSSCCLGCFG